jgi:hypothetical protein
MVATAEREQGKGAPLSDVARESSLVAAQAWKAAKLQPCSLGVAQ